MTEFVCSDCRSPAKWAFMGTDNSDGMLREALFLFCERHPPPLWITLGDFEEVSLDELRVRSVMDV